MTSLAIHDQTETRGQGGAPRRCGMGSSRASAFNHHQVPPPRKSSLARHCGRLVPTTRVGRFFPSTAEILEFMALTRAGLRAEVALANLNPQIGHQASNQTADAAEVTHVSLSKVRVASTATQPREASHGAGEISQGLGNV